MGYGFHRLGRLQFLGIIGWARLTNGKYTASCGAGLVCLRMYMQRLSDQTHLI